MVINASKARRFVSFTCEAAGKVLLKLLIAVLIMGAVLSGAVMRLSLDWDVPILQELGRAGVISPGPPTPRGPEVGTALAITGAAARDARVSGSYGRNNPLRL